MPMKRRLRRPAPGFDAPAARQGWLNNGRGSPRPFLFCELGRHGLHGGRRAIPYKILIFLRALPHFGPKMMQSRTSLSTKMPQSLSTVNPNLLLEMKVVRNWAKIRQPATIGGNH